MDKSNIQISRSNTCQWISIKPNKNMFYGFPHGGAMDLSSAQYANSILQQDLSASLLECTLKAPKILFNEKVKIAITGADMAWKLNEENVELNTEISIDPGQTLTGSYAKTGLRSYIAINKKITAWNDDVIILDKQNKQSKDGLTPRMSQEELIIERGPEWNLLSQEGKTMMISYQGKISNDMNRMGAYLIGPQITLKERLPKISVCVFPGVIQLLPNGQLIVLLQDAQTTGGYPRIAHLKREQLDVFNQLRSSEKVSWSLRL